MGEINLCKDCWDKEPHIICANFMNLPLTYEVDDKKDCEGCRGKEE